jgi:hypothetical protein
MKKAYEKPVLNKKDRLSVVTASPPSSQLTPPQQPVP